MKSNETKTVAAATQDKDLNKVVLLEPLVRVAQMNLQQSRNKRNQMSSWRPIYIPHRNNSTLAEQQQQQQQHLTNLTDTFSSIYNDDVDYINNNNNSWHLLHYPNLRQNWPKFQNYLGQNLTSTINRIDDNNENDLQTSTNTNHLLLMLLHPNKSGRWKQKLLLGYNDGNYGYYYNNNTTTTTNNNNNNNHIISTYDRLQQTPQIMLNHSDHDRLAQLSCDSGEMILRLNFSEPFKGIVYPDHNRLSPCRFFGSGHHNYELRLPLKGCGTRQVAQRVFVNDVIVRFHKSLELEEDEVKTLICRYPPPASPQLQHHPGYIGGSRGLLHEIATATNVVDQSRSSGSSGAALSDTNNNSQQFEFIDPVSGRRIKSGATASFPFGASSLDVAPSDVLQRQQQQLLRLRQRKPTTNQLQDPANNNNKDILQLNDLNNPVDFNNANTENNQNHSSLLLLSSSQLLQPTLAAGNSNGNSSSSSSFFERLSSVELLFLISSMMFLVLLALGLAASYYCLAGGGRSDSVSRRRRIGGGANSGAALMAAARRKRRAADAKSGGGGGGILSHPSLASISSLTPTRPAPTLSADSILRKHQQQQQQHHHHQNQLYNAGWLRSASTTLKPAAVAPVAAAGGANNLTDYTLMNSLYGPHQHQNQLVAGRNAPSASPDGGATGGTTSSASDLSGRRVLLSGNNYTNGHQQQQPLVLGRRQMQHLTQSQQYNTTGRRHHLSTTSNGGAPITRVRHHNHLSGAREPLLQLEGVNNGHQQLSTTLSSGHLNSLGLEDNNNNNNNNNRLQYDSNNSASTTNIYQQQQQQQPVRIRQWKQTSVRPQSVAAQTQNPLLLRRQMHDFDTNQLLLNTAAADQRQDQPVSNLNNNKSARQILVQPPAPRLILKSIDDTFVTNVTELHEQEYIHSSRIQKQPIDWIQWARSSAAARQQQANKDNNRCKLSQVEEATLAPKFANTSSRTTPASEEEIDQNQLLNDDDEEQNNLHSSSAQQNLRSLTELEVDDFAKSSTLLGRRHFGRRRLHGERNTTNSGASDDDDDDDDELTTRANKSSTGQQVATTTTKSRSAPDAELVISSEYDCPAVTSPELTPIPIEQSSTKTTTTTTTQDDHRRPQVAPPTGQPQQKLKGLRLTSGRPSPIGGQSDDGSISYV